MNYHQHGAPGLSRLLDGNTAIGERFLGSTFTREKAVSSKRKG
jgi:hypothetical protein